VLNKRQLRSSHTPVRPPHDQVKKIFGDREAEFSEFFTNRAIYGPTMKTIDKGKKKKSRSSTLVRHRSLWATVENLYVL